MQIKTVKINHWITRSLVLMTLLTDMTNVSGELCKPFSNPVFSSIIKNNVNYSVRLDKVPNKSYDNVVVQYQGNPLSNGNCTYKYCVIWTIEDAKDALVYLNLNISNFKKPDSVQLDINVHLNCSAGNNIINVCIDMRDEVKAPWTGKTLKQIHIGTSIICLLITILTIVVIGLHIYNARGEPEQNFESECSEDEVLCPQIFEIGFIRQHSDGPKDDITEEETEAEIKSELKIEPLKIQKDFRTCFLQEIHENIAKFREKTKMRQQQPVAARRSLIVSSSDVDQAADSLSFQPASIQELLTLHENFPTGKGERFQRQRSESSQILGSSFLREEDNEWVVVEYELPVYSNCVHTVTMETRQLSINDCCRSIQKSEVGDEFPPAACSLRESSSSSNDPTGYVKMTRSPQLDDSGYTKPFRLEDIERTEILNN
ncbi:unnamed protein product [Lymnaea stagnalis]|uniref:Uncharacterized protein n=1 Tax=Lymnaea stagnalis TaxID=6523 RepID=A0AAV2HXF9_LYMST